MSAVRPEEGGPKEGPEEGRDARAEPWELARGTWIVLRAETWRSLRSRLAWITWSLVTLLAAAQAASSALSTAAQRPSLASGGAWSCWADGWRVGLALGALVLVAGGARALAGDLEQGLVRLAVTRCVSRPALILGRALLGPLHALALWLGSGLGAGAAAGGWLDFGPLVDEGYLLLAASEAFGELRLAALAVLPALVATWVLGLFVGTLARSAAGAVAAALGLWLAFDLFKTALLGRDVDWVFAAHAPTLLDTSPFRGLGDLLRGFSDAPATDETLRAALLVPLPQALALCAGALAVLARRRL